jgi:hypothetical protein
MTGAPAAHASAVTAKQTTKRSETRDMVFPRLVREAIGERSWIIKSTNGKLCAADAGF